MLPLPIFELFLGDHFLITTQLSQVYNQKAQNFNSLNQ